MAVVAVMSLLAGLADLLGGWLTLSFALSRERLEQLTALGAGFLLGGAFFTMLPAGLSSAHQAPLLVAAGYLGLFLLRSLGTRAQQAAAAGPGTESVWAALVGMVVHSLLDGGALGMAAQVDARMGLMAFLAVFLHKLPEGFGIAALTLAATRSRRLALAAAGAVGLATMVGAILATLWAGAADLSRGGLLAIAAGSFLYVGATDMAPVVAKQGRHAWLVLAGAALVYLMAGTEAISHAH